MTGKVTVLKEYLDYTNAFLKKSVAELPERFDINKHAINLEPGKQLPYGLIYNLGLVELKSLKTYIKTYLTNGFIYPSKFLVKVPILFVQKPNGSFRWTNIHCSWLMSCLTG